MAVYGEEGTAARTELVRSGIQLPMLRFFRQIGAPVDRELAAAGISSEIEMFAEDYIPVHRIDSVRRRLQRSEGIRDLGAVVFPKRKQTDVRAATLRMALRPMLLGKRIERIATAANRSHTQVNSWVERSDIGKLFKCKPPPAALQADILYFDWQHVLFITNMVRAELGQDWHPPRLGLVSARAPAAAIEAAFPHAQVETGQTAIWVEVPDNVLTFPARALPEPVQKHVQAALAPGAPFNPVTASLAATVKTLIRPCLLDGRATLDIAADLLDSSPRSLQRKLLAEGTSFREIVREIRIERAIELLKVSGLKAIDVGTEVGYENAAHFSRAFKRATGKSPKAFCADLLRAS